MVKQADGSFELTVPFPASSEKLLYKYVVDGEWQVAPHDRIEKDDSGIENNVLESSDFNGLSSGSAIPESGGLPVATGAAGAGALGAAGLSHHKEPEYTPAKAGEAKATVMPTSAPGHASLAGEPGIHIPKDPEALAAFSTVRDVDAKALNEPELTPEERKRQKKKVKRSQYKAKKKSKAAGAADGATESSEFNSTPEPDAATKAVEEETAKDKKTEEILGAAAIGTATAGASAGLAAQVPVDDCATKRAYLEDPEAPAAASGDAPASAASAPISTDTGAAPVSKDVSAPVVSDSASEPVGSVAKTGEPTDSAEAEEPKEHKSKAVPAAVGAGVLGAGAGAAGVAAGTAHHGKDVAAPSGSGVPAASGSAPSKDAAQPVQPAAASQPKDTSKDVAPAVAGAAPVAAAQDADQDLAGGKAFSPVNPPSEVHTLDPKAHPAEKEVAALPVAKPAGESHMVTEVPAVDSEVLEDEEIVIAQGNSSKKQIEAALADLNGNVTLEEIQPTASEAARLKEEAQITDSVPNTAAAPGSAATATPGPAAAGPTGTAAASSSAKTTKKPAKDEKKKKGFMAKLKKIFN